MKINTNRMIELALVFFVSLLSFSIGTYVGKKYSDNQHRLAQLEPKTENTDVAQGHVIETASQNTGMATLASQEKNTMTDADVAKISEEFATEDEMPSDTKTVAEITDHTMTPMEKVEKPLARTNSKPTAAQPSIRDVASTTEVSTEKIKSALYTVQVGAYSNPIDAEKMTESLKSSGHKASSVEAIVNGKTWYRVQVGLFENLQSAQDYRKDLVEKKKLTSAIIQKIQK